MRDDPCDRSNPPCDRSEGLCGPGTTSRQPTDDFRSLTDDLCGRNPSRARLLAFRADKRRSVRGRRSSVRPASAPCAPANPCAARYPTRTQPRQFEDVVKAAEQAAVLGLVY